VIGNRVAGNRVEPEQGHGGWGGGILIYDEGTRAELRDNIVTENYAAEIGSGAFIDDGAEADLHNELIVGNRCPGAGGAGLYVDGLDDNVLTTAAVVNCTIAQHACPGTTGSAIFIERAEVTVENSVIWGNGEEEIYVDEVSSLAVTYSITGKATEGTGNLSADPLFADPSAGDFHLRSTSGRWDPRAGRWVEDGEHSPGIDAADPGHEVGDEPRPNGGRLNLGAFGGTTQASMSAGQ
jgi:hypothetical protein